MDFETLGLPAAATAVVAAQRLPILDSVSDDADMFLPARYTLPVYASVRPVAPYRIAGSAGTGGITAAATTGATFTEAIGIKVEVLTTGASGVATARISTDSGETWGDTFTITAGALVHPVGVTLTFTAGTWVDGDVFQIPVNFGALTKLVVKIGVFLVLERRGFDSDASYASAKSAHDRALKMLEGLPSNKIELNLTDSSPSVNEGGFFYSPETESSGDRRWDSVMGRQARTQPSTASGEEDIW
jgi:hypothetical protein